MSNRRIISLVIRKELLSRQRCSNSPSFPAIGCNGYKCPLWNGPLQGLFDESGKEIDHIVEVKHGGSNELSNLQVLCPCCHSVKTKRCAKQKWDFDSIEIHNGRAHMETETNKKKRRNSISNSI
jgi:5-methylcytosine-specific restriction endonuclease McrA